MRALVKAPTLRPPNIFGTARAAAFTVEQMEARVLLSAVAVAAQPVNEWGSVGGSVTFSATASVPSTVQWKVSTNGGSSFSNVTGSNATVGTSATANESTLSLINIAQSTTDLQYEAVFTALTPNTGAVTTVPGTLVVSGTPIAQWNFTHGQGSIPFSSGPSNNPSYPLPTLAINGASAQTSGLQNDYTGVQAFPEADIHALGSAVNNQFSPYSWRVRSGDGGNSTGDPGTPEGWSQFAPQYNLIAPGQTDGSILNSPVLPQGVQFAVNTSGFQKVTLDFHWNAGGISDMQPQYTSDITAANPVWTNITSGI